MPPTPMTACPKVSLGATFPGPPRTLLGMTVAAAAQHFDGPTDPNYTLVKIAIARIEYMPTGTHEYEVHDF